jgi:spore coat polysaccharide biosynthesis protein SpsF (cytidylyltransferase family)
MSKTGLIIPSRFHSERLPGKALMPLNGIPNLQRIIDRALSYSFIDMVVLAISEDDGQEIEKFINDHYNTGERINFIFGSHNDLASRTLAAAEYYGIDIIIDISLCCTFFDPHIAENLIEKMETYNADYAANCIIRSFPDGFDVQVYTREIYEKINSVIAMNDPTRMWTGWNIRHHRNSIYPSPRIVNMQAEERWYYPEWRLTLDTSEDLKIIEEIYQHLEKHKYDGFPILRDVMNCIASNPSLRKRIEENKTIPTKLLQEPIK